ncbi:MAG: GAF domain-containing protein [Chloroflexi bacterium]|nr:GAF domain-containing protein [Chloroflexota bacterium]
MQRPDVDSPVSEGCPSVAAGGGVAGWQASGTQLLPGELDLLREVSTAVGSSLELRQVLELIARGTLRLTETDIATVFLIGADKGLENAVTVPPEKAFLQTTPRAEGLTTLIIGSGKPVVIPDTTTDSRVNPEVLTRGIRSVLGMPLMTGSQVAGVLYLNSTTPHHFTSHVVTVLSLLADQMAAALRNARLYATVNREKDKLAAIFKHSTDGILILDEDKRVVDLNPGFVSLTGWLKEEAVGRSLEEVLGCVDPLDRGSRLGVCDAEQAIAQSVSLPNVETTIVARDGRSIDVVANCNIVPQPCDQPALLVCFLRDITEQRRSERMKSDFVSTISHELRTPLAVIKGYTSTLLRPDASFPEDQKLRFLQNIDRASNRLIRLIDDLLSVSRMEGGRLDLSLQRIDLRDTVSKVIAEHQISASQSHDVDLTLPDAPLYAMADQFRIEEVLHNLVDNAAKYSPESSTIKVEARRHRRNSERFAGKLPGTRWSLVVSVADCGIGITAEQARHVFEKFYRADNGLARRTRGLGVGLYLSKGLVEAHGGRIWMDSEPGRGSTFYFSLPAAEQ